MDVVPLVRVGESEFWLKCSHKIKSILMEFSGCCKKFASANLDPGQIRYRYWLEFGQKTAEPQLCSSVHIHKIYFYGV